MLGSKIFKFYINYFVIILFAYTIGDFLFLRNIFNSNIWSYINIITFGVLIFIPYSKLLTIDYLKVNKYDIFTKEYKDCISFTQDYERANPINKKEGKINYLKKLKDRQIISENEYQNYLKDIYNINIMQVYYRNKKDEFKINSNEKENNDNAKDNNKNINIINNVSFSSNIKMNIRKKKLKKKKKPLNNNTLNLNKLNVFSSNDIFTNIAGNNSNQE